MAARAVKAWRRRQGQGLRRRGRWRRGRRGRGRAEGGCWLGAGARVAGARAAMEESLYYIYCQTVTVGSLSYWLVYARGQY